VLLRERVKVYVGGVGVDTREQDGDKGHREELYILRCKARSKRES
jgi:hypothetical protein